MCTIGTPRAKHGKYGMVKTECEVRKGQSLTHSWTVVVQVEPCCVYAGCGSDTLKMQPKIQCVTINRGCTYTFRS